MDFTFTPAEEAFRAEVRAWVRENVPGDWGSPAWPIPEDPGDLERAFRAWDRKLYRGGWAGITWPRCSCAFHPSKDCGGR